MSFFVGRLVLLSKLSSSLLLDFSDLWSIFALNSKERIVTETSNRLASSASMLCAEEIARRIFSQRSQTTEFVDYFGANLSKKTRKKHEDDRQAAPDDPESRRDKRPR